jgi:hypothetical protein
MSQRTYPDAIEFAGELYLRDAKANLVPLPMVKPIDLLMDELVADITAEAEQVSGLIAAFRAKTFDKVTAFQKLLAQEHGTTIGGRKGNITLSSFNGCRKVQIAVADRTEFGPELLAAQALIDECLTEWSSTSGAEIRAIVNRAFPVEKEGQINRSALLMLLRVNITDPRWLRAMNAIRESMRVVGSREYARYYRRPVPDGQWRAIPIDIAAV